MEVSAPEKEVNGKNEPDASERKPASLSLAIVLSAISFCVVFYATVKHDFSASPVMNIVREPVLFQSYISRAIGGSIFIPLIHMGIASFFKSKRNSSTRRRIFTAWAIVIITVEALKFFTKH
ncbi:hypothetical protein [Pseudomonas sp. RW405]|uniref:hypothetical protein n=1 Tax=Pseudomonas sp. RW405 TaxID=2202652 RepID=UPI000D7322BB|nr:hypothetical protein [Pseudomonas sp. RW405]PWY44446.1 hypothetical protein DK184_06990 [Pseudomonas sp. RW405]